MSIKSTIEITRTEAINHILKIVKNHIKDEKDDFLNKMNIKDNRKTFTTKEYNDLKKNIEKYTNEILADIMDRDPFVLDSFTNYLVYDE